MAGVFAAVVAGVFAAVAAVGAPAVAPDEEAPAVLGTRIRIAVMRVCDGPDPFPGPTITTGSPTAKSLCFAGAAAGPNLVDGAIVTVTVAFLARIVHVVPAMAVIVPRTRCLPPDPVRGSPAPVPPPAPAPEADGAVTGAPADAGAAVPEGGVARPAAIVMPKATPPMATSVAASTATTAARGHARQPEREVASGTGSGYTGEGAGAGIGSVIVSLLSAQGGWRVCGSAL